MSDSNNPVPATGTQNAGPTAPVTPVQSVMLPGTQVGIQNTTQANTINNTSSVAPMVTPAVAPVITPANVPAIVYCPQRNSRPLEQLSPGQVKELANSNERVSVLFYESENATGSYVSRDYPLALAQAFSSFVVAHATREEPVKIGIQRYAPLGKATLKVVFGANHCPGFRQDDIDRVKLIFKWFQEYVAGKKAIPEVAGQSLLGFVRLQEVADALGVVRLVQPLSNKIDYLTKKKLSLKGDIAPLLSFYDRATSPAKWQVGVDAIAFAVVNHRLLFAHADYQSLAQQHQGLHQDVQHAIQQIQQAQGTQGQASRAPNPRGQLHRGRGVRGGGRAPVTRAGADQTSTDPAQGGHARGAQAQGNPAQATQAQGNHTRNPLAQGNQTRGGRSYGGQARAPQTYASQAAVRQA